MGSIARVSIVALLCAWPLASSGPSPRLRLELASYGRGALVVAKAGLPADVGGEIRIARGAGVVEWWRPLAAGLEHGVTFASRPGGEGSLELHLHVEGATPRSMGETIALRGDDGSTATYSGLVVVDAGGRPVHARMAA